MYKFYRKCSCDRCKNSKLIFMRQSVSAVKKIVDMIIYAAALQILNQDR